METEEKCHKEVYVPLIMEGPQIFHLPDYSDQKYVPRLVGNIGQCVRELLALSLTGGRRSGPAEDFFQVLEDEIPAQAVLEEQVELYIREVLKEHPLKHGGVFIREVQRPPENGAVFSELGLCAWSRAYIPFHRPEDTEKETKPSLTQRDVPDRCPVIIGIIPSKPYEGARSMLVGFTLADTSAQELLVPCSANFPGVLVKEGEAIPKQFKGCLSPKGVLYRSGDQLVIPMMVTDETKLEEWPHVTFVKEATADDFPKTEPAGASLYFARHTKRDGVDAI